MGDSQQTVGWTERRDGVDMLQRLATNKCERMMEQVRKSEEGPADAGLGDAAEEEEEDSPTQINMRMRRRRNSLGGGKKDLRKFFTTHGAGQTPEEDASLESEQPVSPGRADGHAPARDLFSI